MRFLASSGFLLCPSIGSIKTLLTLLLAFGGFPFTPIRQTSQLLFVYQPMPKNGLPFFLFVFIQLKPSVLYLKPHALIVSKPCCKLGKVTHMNKMAFSAVTD